MTLGTDTARTLPLGLQPIDVWTAASTGVLSLVDPARLRPGGRFALRGAAAAIAGAGMWHQLGQDPDAAVDLPRRVALTTGAVGLVLGVAELGEAMDRALQRGLVRLGVRRPRVVMAVAGAGLALGLSVLERRAEGTREDDGDDDAGYPTYRDLPAPVRELVEAILAHTEDYDALRLRAQLAVAREERWGEGEGLDRFVELAVPDDVPLAVPRSFTFPVSARFTSPRGVPCVVQLVVDAGKLRTVLLDVDGPAWGPVADAWEPGEGEDDPLADVSWPSLDDVTLVTEEAGRGQASLA